MELAIFCKLNGFEMYAIFEGWCTEKSCTGNKSCKYPTKWLLGHFITLTQYQKHSYLGQAQSVHFSRHTLLQKIQVEGVDLSWRIKFKEKVFIGTHVVPNKIKFRQFDLSGTTRALQQKFYFSSNSTFGTNSLNFTPTCVLYSVWRLSYTLRLPNFLVFVCFILRDWWAQTCSWSNSSKTSTKSFHIKIWFLNLKITRTFLNMIFQCLTAALHCSKAQPTSNHIAVPN